MSRAVRFAPLAVLLVLLAGLVWRLGSPPTTEVRSRLEGQALPAFTLAQALPAKPGLSSRDLASGEPHLLNIFASWCVPCITEVGVLRTLQAQGVTVVGIAVRDRPQDVAVFLSRNGDPYARIGTDQQSAVQIALGSSGVPESFIVDGRGVVRYQHIGPIERGDVPTILDKLEQAR